MVLIASNAAVSYIDLPNYATWAGVATLEEKLRLYRTFVQQGPVDLVLFGSSIVDHGISAEVLSRDLSVYSGKKYQVFNFSTGKPRALLYLYPGGRGTDETMTPNRVLTMWSTLALCLQIRACHRAVASTMGTGCSVFSTMATNFLWIWRRRTKAASQRETEATAVAEVRDG